MEYSIKEAFDYLHHSSLLQAKYLGIYATVSLAIITYIGSQWGKRIPTQMYVFIFIGYLLFSFINSMEVQIYQHRIETVEVAIKSYLQNNPDSVPQEFQKILKNLDGIISPIPILFWTQFIASVIILALIVVSYFYRRPKNLK